MGASNFRIPFMLKKLLTLPFPLAVALVAGSPPLLAAGWGSRPVVQVMVGTSTGNVEVSTGTTLTITGRATDADGDLKEHWLEIQNPAGTWSWEGWLTGEPWGGARVGSGANSQKSGTFTFSTPGTYVVRSTACDVRSSDWIVSQPVRVTVKTGRVAAGSPPPDLPSSLPGSARPVVQMTVNGGTAPLNVAVGTTLSLAGHAIDADGDMQEHWLEVQNPSGAWSWQGWLTGEPWAGALVGNSYDSTKTTSFTVTEVGTYSLRTTAIDALGRSWLVSNEVKVNVTAGQGSTPPPVVTPPPVTPPPVEPPGPIEPPSSPINVGSIFNGDGSVNQSAYVDYVAVWTKDRVSLHLGPTFAQLNPGAGDDRPTNFKPASRVCATSYVNKINPFELGPPQGCFADNDYWSEAGQVAYVPDDRLTDPGLDRVQVFAYYDNVFALSPRLDWATTPPHPDPQTQDSNYVQLLGFKPTEPVATVRNYGMLQNESLVIYRDGLLAVAGTQTSRSDSERPYPGILFPATKVPTALAVTSGNEFALVTIWDTVALRGQLAVVALEGKYIPFHTWKYMALPNQGSFSDMKLLGYIDLPMAAPSSVAAASNGWWGGPSQTANLVLSQIDLADDARRQGIFNGEPAWTGIVATKGYAIVSSKLDNKAVVVDLAPLINYVRQSYLSSAASFQATTNNRGSGPGQWPATFAEKPEIKPSIVWQKSLPSPTTVLAGLNIDRWSPDFFKAYIAREDGTIHILDTSSLMKRWDWEKLGPLGEVATVKVGRNPTSMCFTRHIESGLPLIPAGSRPDPLNNTLYVACRGDREVDAVVSYGNQALVYRRIRDSRMGDPVAVSVAGRGYILSVADFSGRKLLSFRVGAIVDRYNRFYGCGADGQAEFEFAGEMSFSGYPIAVNTANVN